MKINLSIVYAEEICKYFFGHVTAISTQKLQSDLIFKEDENFNCNQTLPSTHIKTIFQGNNFPLQYHAPNTVLYYFISTPEIQIFFAKSISCIYQNQREPFLDVL